MNDYEGELTRTNKLLKEKLEEEKKRVEKLKLQLESFRETEKQIRNMKDLDD